MLLSTACTSDDETRDNPFLINQSFSYQLHLSFPEYEQLSFNGIHILLPHIGLIGIVIYNINISQFSAFELSDPNYPLRDCSRLLVSGTEASCGDGNVYKINTGQPLEGNGIYTLKGYLVNRSGDVNNISNYNELPLTLEKSSLLKPYYFKKACTDTIQAFSTNLIELLKTSRSPPQGS